MQIGVICQIQPGSLRAHVINTIKTAGGFVQLGHAVRVYCLPPEEGHSADPGEVYAENTLNWRFAPEGDARTDAQAFGRWAALAALADGVDLVYGRNFWGPLLASEMELACVLESHAHAGTENALLDRCLRATRINSGICGVVTIGRVLRDDFVRRGAEASRVHVIADGVDFNLFDRAQGRDYGKGGPHVVYAGHLYDYKGIPSILNAAKLMKWCQFHLVGGVAQDIDRVRRSIAARELAHVTLHGSVPHAQVPQWTRGADVLLLPPSNKEVSKDWTSPVKLGEYLASGPPMVVSRIPALLDALDGEPVEWCEPDDGVSLAKAIEAALRAHDDEPGRMRRREMAQRLSYTARAEQILEAVRLGGRQVVA